MKIKKIFISIGSLMVVSVPIVTTMSCSHEGETQCNDGTFTKSKGRGSCSHHHGVKTWDYHDE